MGYKVITTKSLATIHHHTTDPLLILSTPHPHPRFPVVTTNLFSVSIAFVCSLFYVFRFH